MVEMKMNATTNAISTHAAIAYIPPKPPHDMTVHSQSEMAQSLASVIFNHAISHTSLAGLALHI